MNPIGWRIYYTDGTTFSSRDGSSTVAPSLQVQVVKVFYNETYSCWVGDRLAGHLETYSYQKVLSGATQDADYYWQEDDGDWQAGLAVAIPPGKVGTTKTGAAIDPTTFRAILNRAHQPERWG